MAPLNSEEWWENYFSDVFSLTSALNAPRARKEVEFIINLGKFPKAPAEILDLACGDGRHSLEFFKRGYRVTGIDYSSVLISKAQKSVKPESSKQILFLKQDMRISPPSRSFDAAVSLFMSLGYFENESDNHLAIKNLCYAIKKGGIFVIEINNYHKALRGGDKTYEFPGKLKIHDSRKYNSSNKRLIIQRSVTKMGVERVYSQQIRIWTPEEIQLVLHSFGCYDFETFGGFDGSTFDSTSNSLLIVGRVGCNDIQQSPP